MCEGLPFTLDPSSGGRRRGGRQRVLWRALTRCPDHEWTGLTREVICFGRQLGVSMEGSQREQCALLWGSGESWKIFEWVRTFSGGKAFWQFLSKVGWLLPKLETRF